MLQEFPQKLKYIYTFLKFFLKFWSQPPRYFCSLVYIPLLGGFKKLFFFIAERKKILTAQNRFAKENLNLTIEMETKFVLAYSTISMPMVSNGMMFLVTTENQRFVNFRQMDFILKCYRNKAYQYNRKLFLFFHFTKILMASEFFKSIKFFLAFKDFFS